MSHRCFAIYVQHYIYILHSEWRAVWTPECPLWPHDHVLFSLISVTSHIIFKIPLIGRGVKICKTCKIMQKYVNKTEGKGQDVESDKTNIKQG